MSLVICQLTIPLIVQLLNYLESGENLPWLQS